MTAKLLDEQFEAAKNKMEWLANKFRALLRSGDNVVYILWYTTPPNASQLIDLLLKKSTGKFHILLTGLEPLDSAVFGNVASSFIMPETVGKAIERQWEGDDNDWDRLFDILRGPSHPSP